MDGLTFARGRDGAVMQRLSVLGWRIWKQKGLPRGLAVAVLKPLLYEILMERTVFIESCR